MCIRDRYDTLSNKRVFSDITPVRYMTADELSNPYFSNLKPSSLGSEMCIRDSFSKELI